VILNRLCDDTPANRRAADDAGTTVDAVQSFMRTRGVLDMFGDASHSTRVAMLPSVPELAGLVVLALIAAAAVTGMVQGWTRDPAERSDARLQIALPLFALALIALPYLLAIVAMCFFAIGGRPAALGKPFERGIVEEGEFSMMYFNGVHSHTILKVPKPGDFRVQEEYGSSVAHVEPVPALLAAGDAAMAAVGKKLLYARVDFVRSSGAFRLMELELVEPSIYLRTEPGAPERFADAVAVRLS